MPQNRAAVHEDIVRKGSKIVPLLLLLLAVLIFLSYFGPPPSVSPGDASAANRFSADIAAFIAKELAELRGNIAADVPKVIASQMMNVLVVALFSLIPGVVGLIYRRALT
jgi:hypothetical protein